MIKTIPNSKEIEIIVVDDHSDPLEKNKLQKLRDKYFYKYSNLKLLNNDPGKKGAGACRNIGLVRAIGKWVLFADSDDFFLGNFFDIVQKYFQYKYDVVFFTPTSVEIDTGKISDRHLPYQKLINNQIRNANHESEIRLRYFFHVPWSKLVNINFMKRNNIYFDEVIASNDVMFSTKIGYYMKTFEISEKTIYCVTRSRGSLTTTVSPKVFEARVDVFTRYYRFLKERALNKSEFKLVKLNLSGRYILINSLSLGLQQFLFSYKKLRENNVHILDKEYINPFFFIKKGYSFYIKKRRKKKYYKKK